MLTPQLAKAPVRSMPAPITTSLSVTPSSARAGPPGTSRRRPTSTLSTAAGPTSLFMASPPFSRVIASGPAVARSSLAEIRPPHAVVAQKLLAAAAEGDRPRLQHVSVVRDRERLVRVLLDEQHRGPAGVDLPDDPEDLLHEHG